MLDQKGSCRHARLEHALAEQVLACVVQDADSTDIYQISRVWSDLVKRARSKQLAPDEYHSGNFTISNLGMFGADKFDAILPPGRHGHRCCSSSAPRRCGMPATSVLLS